MSPLRLELRPKRVRTAYTTVMLKTHGIYLYRTFLAFTTLDEGLRGCATFALIGVSRRVPSGMVTSP